MSKVVVDRYDVDLLLALQRDGRATNSALGEEVHLSTSQVSRRIQRLEESEVISHYVAVLKPEVVGLGVIAFTHVTLERQGEQGGRFEQAIADIPEVLECLSVTGEADYILRIAVPDLASFADFMTACLLRLPGVANVKSTVTLKTIKQTFSLPLEHIKRPAQAQRQISFAK
ncbi:Lrp/AsnC family transcriptional regulator [Janthinobacterium fluminis]|uniref:Lrp/AsnC family transcriptional regulator n=1 Tax=Janthinobacterium fluminis TaxID=2987524 RepID=A0ABT5JZZ6_9BURK|nr:Lrp/AsnC family transcriptional regulator [Janthinobacterium fluminis]MDC8757077.1 Lrp/AsnC family transcriptional regulator [Janthinobacterium fluminis]